jgi:CheY-like chemotaxis protein/DNA-directed RNA polymerase subunit RPC12/RpoP
MKCPRCQAPITAAPDAGGFLICLGCGARLMVKPVPKTKVDAHNPNLTLPPGTLLKKIPRPGEDTARSGKAAVAATAPTSEPPSEPVTLDTVLGELRALRRGQDETLRLLRAGVTGSGPGAEPSFDALDEYEPALVPPVRSKQRKTIVLIDDDKATREAALAQLKAADIPSRAFVDGNAALEAIAKEKPDVIAIELELGGKLAGKDVINMIKATMEWVDIPILLYTRASVEGQREARQVHGADDIVPKESGAEALVAKVVSIFRRS